MFKKHYFALTVHFCSNVLPLSELILDLIFAFGQPRRPEKALLTVSSVNSVVFQLSALDPDTYPEYQHTNYF